VCVLVGSLPEYDPQENVESCRSILLSFNLLRASCQQCKKTGKSVMHKT